MLANTTAMTRDPAKFETLTLLATLNYYQLYFWLSLDDPIRLT